MEIVHFLIAMIGLGVFGAGLSSVAVDWLLYTYLFRRFSDRMREGLALVFSITTAVVIFLLIVANLINYATPPSI